MVLDSDGDVDGLLVINGVGYETHAVPQKRPDSGESVYLSGDGTVNYQSLRWPKTWQSKECQVACFELPGCDHRGVSQDVRVMRLLKGILDLGADCHAEEGNGPEESLGTDSQEIRHCIDAIHRSRLFGCVAKTGLRWFGRHRKWLRFAMQLLAVGSFAFSGLILCTCLSKESSIVSAFAWAEVGLDFFGCEQGAIGEAAVCWERDRVSAHIAAHNVTAWNLTVWDNTFDPAMELGVLTFRFPGHRRDANGTWLRSTEACVGWYSECAGGTFVTGDEYDRHPANATECIIPNGFKDICRQCYLTGWSVFTVSGATVVIQCFLLIMVGLRVNAATDGRCAKFWSTGLTAAVLVMNFLAQFMFYEACYLSSNTALKEDLIIQGWAQLGSLRSRTTLWLATPAFAACCAGIGWLLNILIPVPEIFASEICHQERHGYSENHLHLGKAGVHMQEMGAWAHASETPTNEAAAAADV